LIPHNNHGVNNSLVTATPLFLCYEHPTQHNTTTSTTQQITTHNQVINPSTNPHCMQDIVLDPADNPHNQCPLKCPTTTWIHETYIPVFQSHPSRESCRKPIQQNVPSPQQPKPRHTLEPDPISPLDTLPESPTSPA